MSKFMLLSVSQTDTEVLIALQMTFVTARLHLLKKQNSGTTGVGANARVIIPAPLREVVHPVWGRMVA